MAIILVRAGMGMDPGALKRLSCAVFRLAFSPCIVELCCTGVVSHFLLGLPWTFAFILGLKFLICKASHTCYNITKPDT